MRSRSALRRRAVTAALAATAAVLWVVPAPRAMTPPCCAPVPAGLTAWWSGDDTSADRLGTHDGAGQGGAAFTDAEVRRGCIVDSVDDIFVIPDAADLWPGTGSFTVDAWARTTDTAQPSDPGVRHYECAGACPVSAAADWDLRIIAGKAWGFIRDEDNTGADAGGQQFDGTSSIADGAFHHLALVRDMTAGEGRLYVDGVAQDTEALNSGADGNLASLDSDSNPVTIGGGILGGTSNPDA